VWFYLSEFVDMVDEAPSSDEFAQTIAELHKHGVDPDGMFGWPHPVFSGTSAQIFPLSKSWEETFSRGIQQTFALETASQGHDDELSRLETALVEKVIPRLLRPLQTEGRNIMPTLVHGDLWDGNVALDADTGDAIIFDPTAMYAHNECKLLTYLCYGFQTAIYCG
jgi:fructosamine-3-kinase